MSFLYKSLNLQKTIFLLICISVFIQPALSQIDTINQKTIRYTPAFKFKDGIFLNFEQFRQNTPLPKARIATNAKLNDFDFFDKLLEDDEIKFYDAQGIVQSVKESEIWGYCDKGVPFIRHNNEYNRIPVIGSICHFVANKTYVEYGYSPYGYHDFYEPSTTRSELRQYLLNTETGEIFDYTPDAVEVLLMKDPELYDEFNNLKRNKKKKSTFLYIRKFNEKHPLMISGE